MTATPMTMDEGDLTRVWPAFDRRVPESLLNALARHGAFHPISDLVRDQQERSTSPLDLGLRASPKQPGEGHAVLYLGTTQVLGIHVRRDGLSRLSPHEQGKLFKDIVPAFESAWGSWQSLEALSSLAPEIRRHVDAAIEGAPEGLQLEGRYQAALSRPQGAGYALVDREVTLAWASQTEKSARIDELRAPLVEAQRALAAEHPWAVRMTAPGDKLDALAIDAEGRLLAIEVKPGTQTNSLGWTPIQVAMYVRLLRAWTEADPELAREVLEGMVGQRVVLGLTTTEVPRLRVPIEVVPVIAVGRPIRNPPEARKRFGIVRDALRAQGEPLDGLRLWSVEKTGELSVTDATDIDDRF